jgi:hypothetical protein
MVAQETYMATEAVVTPMLAVVAKVVLGKVEWMSAKLVVQEVGDNKEK